MKVFQVLASLLLFSVLLKTNPGTLAGDPNMFTRTPLCDRAIFDTTHEITKENRRFRYAKLQQAAGVTSCETPFEIIFNPELYTFRLYIHRDLIDQLTAAGHFEVKLSSDEIATFKRSSGFRSGKQPKWTTRTFQGETYYLLECKKVALISKLSIRVVPFNGMVFQGDPIQGPPPTTTLQLDRFANQSSIPLVIVQVESCLTDPPVVADATWSYKHNNSLTSISYKCNNGIVPAVNLDGNRTNTMECINGNWIGDKIICYGPTVDSTDAALIGGFIIAAIVLFLFFAGFLCGRFACRRRQQQQENNAQQVAVNGKTDRAKEEPHIYETIDYKTIISLNNRNQVVYLRARDGDSYVQPVSSSCNLVNEKNADEDSHIYETIDYNAIGLNSRSQFAYLRAHSNESYAKPVSRNPSSAGVVLMQNQSGYLTPSEGCQPAI